MLVYLPPGVQKENKRVYIPIDSSISLYHALEGLSQLGISFVSELLEGKGRTSEGYFTFILNGKIIDFTEATKIMVSEEDQLYVIMPIYGG